MFDRPRSGERALLVRIGSGGQPAAAELEELSALASSAGALPVGVVTGSRQHPDPRYYVGTGKAEELKARAEELSADVILVDHALSPSQERNLEKLTGRRVLDRSGLILDIFAQRARSHEGKLQVELAQLKHLQSRLVRGWTHLERQKGGIGEGDVPQLEVYNKVDLLGESPRLERDADGVVSRVWLSAATGEGLDLLQAALAERFGSRLLRVDLRIGPRHGRARAELYRRGAVLAETAADDGGWQLSLEVAENDLDDLCRREGLARPLVGGTAPCVATGTFLQSAPAAASSL